MSRATSADSFDESDFAIVNFPPQRRHAAGYELKQVHGGRQSLPKDLLIDRSQPLTRQQFEQMFDSEGRMVNESAFRRAVFRGGTDESIRAEAWSYLFGLYSPQATHKERELIKTSKEAQYHAVVHRWKEILKQRHPNYDFSQIDNYQITHHQINNNNIDKDSLIDCDENKPQCSNTSNNDDGHTKSGNGEDKCAVLETPPSVGRGHTLGNSVAAMQVQIFARRLCCSVQVIEDCLHSVLKDVPRSDRTHPWFREDHCEGQLLLRDGLLAQCLLEPSLGYVQGMNDIYVRFMIALQMQPIGFWCFHHYIIKMQQDFLAASMLQRIESLKMLLATVDRDLFHYLRICGADDLLFCHRWLLLSFQREFNYADGLTLLEVLGSQHLELSSAHGLQTRERLRLLVAGTDGDHLAESAAAVNNDFDFDLFVAAAILTLHRDKVFNCADASHVHQIVNKLSGQLDLDCVLTEAQRLFHEYCHMSVLDSFVMI